MANEITVPLLPCRSIDEIVEFYGMLSGSPGHGSCLVIVPDTGELYRSFAAAMRAAYGRVLVAGIPRATRPRKRKNAEGLSGFAVIDPGGNWIRIMAAKAAPEEDEPARGKLGAMLENAVVMGDSHGFDARAAEILDCALARNADTASATDLVEALAYRAELGIRAGDSAAAGHALADARAVPLSEVERDKLAETLAGLDDLEAQVTSGPSSGTPVPAGQVKKLVR